ncbi:MAG: hypothetical protein JXA30_21065, partial [Deltaproteobacteria bacterium]|nr:hypothetical protein [Deltaproteobacteria bacterium]
RCRLISAGQARALQRFHVRRLILVNAYGRRGSAAEAAIRRVCTTADCLLKRKAFRNGDR